MIELPADEPHQPLATPGVYLQEINAFPSSVIAVPTAVPAFVGYTETTPEASVKTGHAGRNPRRGPCRIRSLAEYQQAFGGPPEARFEIQGPGPTAPFTLTQPDGAAGGRFVLYRSLQLFYENGGADCYIVPVGDYTAASVHAACLLQGIDCLLQEEEPTLLVVPDAVLLSEPECIRVQQAMLTHCGEQTRSRMAVFDLWGGWKSRINAADEPDCVTAFREHIGSGPLDFAAAYYPWLNASVVPAEELGHANILNPQKLQALLRHELLLEPAPEQPTPLQTGQLQAIADLTGTPPPGGLKQVLAAMSPLFTQLVEAMRQALNLLPPAAAMVGIYTRVDATSGSYCAPANTGFASVVSASASLTDTDQEDLNLPADGKAVNAIREIPGRGLLVWGARTLAGNSPDWRYIPVRRTLLMIEQSCQLALRTMVFAPNTAITWTTVKSMLSTFLMDLWVNGALQGASAADAFSVGVGLGDTMTPQDILDGYLRVSLRVCVAKRGEFIEVTLQQMMPLTGDPAPAA